MTIKIYNTVFEPFIEIQNFQHELALKGKFGATSIFIGTMRDFNNGEKVNTMSLEYYESMVFKQLNILIENAKKQWNILDCLIVHRIGEILPNDTIVLISVWAAHRNEAFAACRYLIEELKSNVPFWKLEQLESNEKRWVSNSLF